MAIKHLDYKTIPRERRKRQATRAMGKMREMLQLDPTLTPEARESIGTRIKHLSKWVDGKLEPGPPPTVAQPPKPEKKPAEPKKHEVVVEEKMGVDDGGGPKKAATKKEE